MNEFGSLKNFSNQDSTSTMAAKSGWQKFLDWRTRHTFLSLILEIILLLLFVVIPFRTLVAQPFMVSGDSMVPNFHNNDYLIVNQLGKRLGTNLDRYDVIVFKYPRDESKYFIKRIVGLPGEHINVSNGTVTVFNETYPDGMIVGDDYTMGATIGTSDLVLEEDEYFVLGDNRDNSSDSRFWGPLPIENIIGTPLVRIYPFKDADLNPGKIGP